MNKIKLAILASGSGTNAANIAEYFASSNKIDVSLIATNNKSAYVLERAKRHDIVSMVFSESELHDKTLINNLHSLNIDYIILAGFLLKIPTDFIKSYENKILNIHPSLLPKYGGKGMYGSRVHKEVLKNKETKSGITIHLVNKEYDQGEILKQVECKVLPEDDDESLAKRIHMLEYSNYPSTIEDYILGR